MGRDDSAHEHKAMVGGLASTSSASKSDRLALMPHTSRSRTMNAGAWQATIVVGRVRRLLGPYNDSIVVKRSRVLNAKITLLTL